MKTKEDIFYEAMLARDHRFDGKFFVGVKTTGIYCRPICPAKPKRENVEFFGDFLSAEKAGYRPCMRCRPESAPLSGAWLGKSAMVQRAVKIINQQETISFDENHFADLFGVSSRHLRRVFTQEIGKTPKQLAFENRLNVARKLIVETSLPLTQIAFASGFESIRRFNSAFKDRFKQNPSEIRRAKPKKGSGLKISLAYRPPYDFEGLLQSYKNHRVGNLERFEDGKMIRVISFDRKVGEITISHVPQQSSVQVEIDFPDTSFIHVILAKVRILFDLDSDPVLISNSLEKHEGLKKILHKHPGIRLPSGWDPFEVAVATILGQLVSVDFGRTLVADLIEMLGEDSGLELKGKAIKLFPTPKKIAQADLSKLKTTEIRKETLKLFAQAVASKKLSLEPTQDIENFYQAVRKIKGIGPWTASYMCLKALRHTDAFPETDLILKRALQNYPLSVINEMSPWRGYAAALLWKER
jgi:AraC family transcriptional regulator of adaptative response / DNA-3-methyladenine glycosylase II